MQNIGENAVDRSWEENPAILKVRLGQLIASYVSCFRLHRRMGRVRSGFLVASPIQIVGSVWLIFVTPDFNFQLFNPNAVSYRLRVIRAVYAPESCYCKL